ncbi:hypothetical protein ACWEGQ_18135, partial [Streptomyces seoulensis]
MDPVLGMIHHCWPTEGPPAPAAVTVGLAPQARPVVDVASTPSSWPVGAVAVAEEASAAAANYHEARAVKGAARHDLV